MANYTYLVPLPAPGSINTGTEPCPTALIIRRFGMPVDTLANDCAEVRSLKPEWKARMVTADVGPFRATGHRLAIDLLIRSLSQVRADRPKLFGALGSAGMLCVRHVRGRRDLASNHAFGLAIDFSIAGELDSVNDGRVQRGLLDLYAILKRFGWFWGAEFGREDAMHFEVSSSIVREWINRGVF